MAFSTCPKCEGRFWELEEVSPQNGRYKHYFIQCSNCGAPAGVVDYVNAGAKLQQIETGLGALAQSVSYLDHRLRNIEDAIQQIARK